MTGWTAQMAMLTYADLGNLQTLGVDLYLGVVVVQVIVSAAISGLRLRTRLAAARVDNALAVATADALHSEILNFERNFHRASRRLIGLALLLLLFAIIGVVVAAIGQHRTAGVTGTLAVIGFYIVSPTLIFAVALWRAWKPFHRIDLAMRAVEQAASPDA